MPFSPVERCRHVRRCAHGRRQAPSALQIPGIIASDSTGNHANSRCAEPWPAARIGELPSVPCETADTAPAAERSEQRCRPSAYDLPCC